MKFGDALLKRKPDTLFKQSTSFNKGRQFDLVPTLSKPDQSVFAKKEKCNFTPELLENELADLDFENEYEIKPSTKVKTNICNELDIKTPQALGFMSGSLFQGQEPSTIN